MKLLDLLKEIGDSTKGYAHHLDYKSDGQWEYSFKDNYDNEIAVDIYENKGYLVIDFSMPYDNPGGLVHAATNLGDQYRIMGTIVDITRKVIGLAKKQGKDVKGIVYQPSFEDKDMDDENPWKPKQVKKGEPLNQRDRLYRAYIQKAFPNAKFSIRQDKVKVDFPKK